VVQLAANDRLKVRHSAPSDVAADAEQSDVGDVMMTARVEAAAGLDVQMLGRLGRGRCPPLEAPWSAVTREPAMTRCRACRCRCRGRR
jgi:hypothetical protein